MGTFNFNAKGSVVGYQATNITGGTVTVNGRKVTVHKPVKIEIHYTSGKVTRFTEDDPEVIAEWIKDGKTKKRYSHVVVDGKRYGK
ncbi:hypothetical protein OH802_09735 [Nocardioides sp. NBC_00850]|uniref:hypothetical protein n=1 Tax=Nocardioides sp. NBC_00850 TaxID=2976001 RepID=UPI00386FB5C0|nr:hypothetical protein OH802_09735 [Nocardioides sp. NBC_00850]